MKLFCTVNIQHETDKYAVFDVTETTRNVIPVLSLSLSRWVANPHNASAHGVRTLCPIYSGCGRTL